MKTKLQAIENPEGFLMKIAYWVTKRKFGKVLTPLKVIYSRLPLAFSLWVDRIHSLEQKLEIEVELSMLIRVHVSQLNTCRFCIDIGKMLSIQQFKNEEKFYHLAQYQHSDLYTAREKAALEFAEELTRHKKVSEAVFRRAQRQFSDEQLVAIAWVVSTEHVYNLMNVAFDIESDGLCALMNPAETGLPVKEMV